MLPKEDRKAMLLRIYNDNGDIIDHQKERRAQEQANIDRPIQHQSAPDDPAPNQTYVIDQRTADMEEVSHEARY